MKHSIVVCLLLIASTAAFGAPCLPGTLQDYIDLGAGGCNVGSVLFNNFSIDTGLGTATPVAPAQISVTPGGDPFTATLMLTSSLAAGPGDLLQSFFRLNATSMSRLAFIMLDGAMVTGDGAVTGILDLCSGGSFSGPGPIGCSGSSDSALAVVSDGFSMPMDSRSFASSGFFDIFVDLTVDGGLSGNAMFSSATIGLQSVPEPGIAWLTAGGLITLALARRRRNNGGEQS